MLLLSSIGADCQAATDNWMKDQCVLQSTDNWRKKKLIKIQIPTQYFWSYFHLPCGNCMPLEFFPGNFSKGYLERMICEPGRLATAWSWGYVFYSYFDDMSALRWHHFTVMTLSGSLAPVSLKAALLLMAVMMKDDHGPVDAQRGRPWDPYRGAISISNVATGATMADTLGS